MDSYAPRVFRPRYPSFDRLIYKDSATTPPKMRALLFDGHCRHPSLLYNLSVDAPCNWMSFFKKTCLIFGMELLAPVATLGGHGPSLSGLAVRIYMDRSNFPAAVTRGDPNAAVIAVLAARVWELIQRYNICAWFSRFPSKPDPIPLLQGEDGLPTTPTIPAGENPGLLYTSDAGKRPPENPPSRSGVSASSVPHQEKFGHMANTAAAW